MASFHLAQMSVGFQGTLPLVLFHAEQSITTNSSLLFLQVTLKSLQHCLASLHLSGQESSPVMFLWISCQQKLSMLSRDLFFLCTKVTLLPSFLIAYHSSQLFVSLHLSLLKGGGESLYIG